MIPFQTDINKVFVVIPALNEANRIGKVLSHLIQIGYRKVVVINDGSTDNTAEVVKSFSDEFVVIDHNINLGPGASTMTGIEYCLSKGAEIIATIDADYQHDPNDIHKLIVEMERGEYDLVIGSRFKQANEIPKIRVAYNFAGNIVSYFKTGVFVSDSQSGLKVLRRSFADNIAIQYNGFEFCIDIIRNAKLQNVKIGEAPIHVRYSEDTMSKGQSLQSGIMMLGKLLNPFSN